MKFLFLRRPCFLALGLLCLQANAITVTVPGASNPWLAGAANGTTGLYGQDVAPAQSPVSVVVQAGDTLSFFTTGTVEPPTTGITPEGNKSLLRNHPAFNGIGGITNAPLYSLIGVFLDASVPATGGEPSDLDFSGATRDYTTLAPALRQPFFIGNGMDKTGTRQQITVPTGATRLLLGSMFEHSWYYRTGSFKVTVETAPTPSNGITWGTPFTVTGPADVSTSGALIGAYSIADYTGAPNLGVTLNGVLFSGLVTQYIGASAGPFTLYGDVTRGSNGLGDSVAPYMDLDADYRTLLNSGVYDNSLAAHGYTLTIGDLEIGEKYSLQFWANESNGGTQPVVSANATVITDVNSVTLDRNTSNQVGGVGQTVIGTFTANTTHKTFRITSSLGGPVVLNAFQLRKLPPNPADVVWQTPTAVSSPADVVTSGTLVGAYDVSSAPVTIFLNGVKFAPFNGSSTPSTVDNFTLTRTGSTFAGNYGSGNMPFASLDPNYQALLASAVGSGVSATGTTMTLSMDSLTIGQQYTVQFWVNESSGVINPLVPSTEYSTVIMAGNSVTLDRNSTNDGGGVGQYVVGTFTADSTSKVFTLTATDGGMPILNGFQLRKAGANPAAVTWQTPTAISGPSDVTTSEDLVAAYNVQGTAQPVTVNDVLFDSFVVNETGGTAGDFTLTPNTSTTDQTNNYGSPSAPFSGLNSDYRSLLQSAFTVYPSASYNRWFTLTMGSLTVGKEYIVQFWVNESRNQVNSIDTGAEKPTIINSGTSVSLDRNTTNAVGGMGQFVTGTFTATSATQTFTFSAADGAAPTLNAFQLRRVNNAPVFTTTFLPAPGQSFAATGGTGPYSFSIVAGALPVGMTMSSAGLISGAPTASGNGSVTVRVTDGNGDFRDKVFAVNVDIFVPEITMRRIVIQAGMGTQRLATFEVTAADDLALAPFESDSNYTNASHCFEYRYRTGTGGFGTWTQSTYFPGQAQPSVWWDNTSALRFEVRATDAAGNRSRTLAYDLARNIAASTQPTWGPSVSASTPLISNAGSSIVKLFAEDLNGDSSPEVAAVDRDTGKISVSYTTNRAAPAANKQTSLILSDTPITDAAVGKLLPLATGASDQIPDFVVCTAAGLKIVINNRATAPLLRLSPTTLTASGYTLSRVAVGDVDGDGFDDIIAIGNGSGNKALAVFKNRAATGVAGFGAPTLIPLGADFLSVITAGDINGDHIADILVAGQATGDAAAVHSVFCFLGRYELGLNTTGTTTLIGQEIVDLAVADYTQHLMGKKDVIVGTIEGPDNLYPTASHIGKHRVLVHLGNGVFNVAPARRLTTINLTPQELAADKAVFNIAIGPLTDRVTPDVIGCSYASTGGGGTFDSGFLPPASATGALNWMEDNVNGVTTFGTSSGKARRVALADISGNSQPDVLLANADSGHIELQTNTKPILANAPSFPALVTPAPALRTPTLASLVPGGRTNGANAGIAFQPWSFAYTIGTPPADLVARIEFQRDNGPWSNLPGGTLRRSGNTLSTTIAQVPTGLLRFRCIASSANSGLYDAYSTPSIYIRSITSQALAVQARAYPDSSPDDNVSTHDEEFVTYYLNYTNTGAAPAQNVILAGAIPANTTFTTRPSGISHSSNFILDNPDFSKTAVVSWNLGTVGPGASTNRFYTVQVKPNALAVLKGKSIELKAMPQAQISAPAATAADFIKSIGAGKTYGIYSSAPAPGFRAQAATGTTISTPVVPGLTLVQTIDTPSLKPGALVNVTITVTNYGASTLNNIIVSDYIEPWFFVEAVRPRSPANALTGNFNGTLDNDPRDNENPSLRDRPAGRFLTWNVGRLQGRRSTSTGLPQSPGTCTIEYQLRLRYDTDPRTLINDQLVVHIVGLELLSATGEPTVGPIEVARVDVMPKVSTAVEPDLTLNPPQLSFVQDCVPLVGTNGATATEPSNRQEMNVGGEDMAVVTEGGLIRVKLKFENTGGTEAKRCILNYQVPEGAQFLGFMRANEQPGAGGGALYEYFDSKGVLIPQLSLGTRTKEVRSIRYLHGNLPAGQGSSLDFIIAAVSPPIPKPTNEKITPAGTVIKSFGYTLTSDSYSLPVQGMPRQVPVFVARPVSFDIESRPDKGQVFKAIGASQDIRYLITFRNNGWTAASNVKVQASIPAGTTLISSSLLNSDLTSQFISGTPRNAANASVTAGLATKVEFDIGTLASGFQNNPAAYGYAEIIVRIPAVLPTTFPKDGRLKHRSEITGTDTATGKRSQGSYSLFAAPSGIATADRVKNLSSSTVAEVKVLQTNAKLFAGKQVPTIVRPGQLFPIIIFFGNTGDTAITNARVAVQVPWGTDFVSAGTTPGFTKFTDKDAITGKSTPNVYRWNFPSIAGHEARAVTMIVRLKNDSSYEGNYLFENSAVVTGTAGTTTVERVPGNVRMLVLSTNPVASAWQWWGAQLQAIGSNLFGQTNPAIKNAVGSIGFETRLTAIAGADLIAMPNGAFIVPLQGGNIVAGGAGNIVAAGAGNIVAGGAGNIVAGGAGNIVAAGAGNLITVNGVGDCNPSNLANIVAGGAGNIVAGGAGNLIANDGASLIANDGASLGAIAFNAANIVAGGAGNIVAGGAGNIVAAGGGNIVAAGGGNVSENLVSSRPGAALLPTTNGFIQASSLIANDGSSLLANDGASLIANDGASLIANDGASILSDQGGGLITK
jgi:uncharacterized repeat protein (TIGR01451 family)